MITTLNKIRAHSPCRLGWEKLLRGLNKTQADDEPLAITTILDINGISDALWCLRSVEGHDRELRLYADWYARRRPARWMDDDRSFVAREAADRYARGEATQEEFALVAAAAARTVIEASSGDSAAVTTAKAIWAEARDTERAAQAAELRRICKETAP